MIGCSFGMETIIPWRGSQLLLKYAHSIYISTYFSVHDDLHTSGKDGLNLYTRKKVVTGRWVK